MDGRFDADHEAPSGGAGRAGGGGGGAQPPHVNVEIPFADRMASWGKRALIVAAIVIILVGLAAYWWFHPPINIHIDRHVDVRGRVHPAAAVPAVLGALAQLQGGHGQGRARTRARRRRSSARRCMPVAVAVRGRLGRRDVAVASSRATRRSTPRCCRQWRTTSPHDIKEVNYSEIPVIDRDSAILLGNREMGSIPEYVSQFEISPLVQPDQLPERAGAREPAGLCRPVQVVHQPRGAASAALRAGEHDDAGCGDRARWATAPSTTRSPSRSCATSTVTCS